MRKISPEVIKNTLAIYKPNKRILREASIEYPTAKGTFLIGPCDYVQEGVSVDHATDIEIQLCLNQLGYVAIAEAIRNKELSELEGLDFNQLQTNSMFIIESNKKFRKPIRTDKEIYGTLSLKKWKNNGNLYLCWADFQFEDRSCFGGLEFALTKSKQHN
jgi:hypothetical protein